MEKPVPSMDLWLREAKASENADKIGMYLTHNGVVRSTSRAQARNTEGDTRPVTGMLFSYDRKKLDAAVDKALGMDGIYYVKVWLNEGILKSGDDIMYVLIGGDIRPHTVDCLQSLVGTIKNTCVTEQELH
ncbi:MAG: molybdopterin biosynthesis protein [Parasporobacterium sp.]|nr:molybdopterin biosynthesis protein [Parasporobacterium sp.]